MSVLKAINKKSFTISSGKNVEFRDSGSPFMGCQWKLFADVDLRRMPAIFTLDCHGPYSSLWSLDATVTLIIIQKGGARRIAKANDVRFDPEKQSHTINKIMMKEGDTYECLVEIKAKTGIYILEHDFECPDLVNTTAIDVDTKTFYVNKAMLSNFSPVFRAMFNSDFREKATDKFSIGEVRHEDFDTLLQVLYGYCEVNEWNSCDLLVLADRFDIEIVMFKCERDLMRDVERSAFEKLQLAEKYRLANLQAETLRTINPADLDVINRNSNKFSFLTMRKLLDVATRLATQP